MIWVAGLVRQSAATVAIFEPGSDCGMPYAPEDGFCAYGFQLLSRCQSESRHDHCSPVKPRSAARIWPTSRGGADSDARALGRTGGLLDGAGPGGLDRLEQRGGVAGLLIGEVALGRQRRQPRQLELRCPGSSRLARCCGQCQRPWHC